MATSGGLKTAGTEARDVLIFRAVDMPARIEFIEIEDDCQPPSRVSLCSAETSWAHLLHSTFVIVIFIYQQAIDELNKVNKRVKCKLKIK